MEIIIQGKGIELTEALKEYAKKKLSRIEHFFSHIDTLEIELEVNKTKDEAQSQIAKATVVAAGKPIHATEASQDMYASIDMLVDTLDVQIKKLKDKLIHEKRRDSAKEKQILHSLNAPVEEDQPGE